MKYGRMIAIVISAICIILLISSYLTWKSRLEHVKAGTKTIHSTQIELTEKEDVILPKKEESVALSRTIVENSIKNADKKVQNLLLNRLDAGAKVQLLIVGSSSMEEGAPGYASLLNNALTDTYGDFVETTVLPFDGTSKQFIEGNMADLDWEKGYDLILLEPFTLNNNGKVKIEDEQKHIIAIKDKALEEVSDAVIVLQPSYPIYNANFYLVQIRSLKNFSATNAYPYINHWSAWPDTTDSRLKSLLTEDQRPNSEGAKVWASPLITYFTGK
ncbi:SGNH/GDSL hydrolase family protein [Psychrobacillus sp. NEAU-3TGS]|uniref:SGNH/GDSL hydrolase family protein n=1 Tax=Psychrobacillus sp. NEAU-3TGS TaxID=2995412 RepID=UPI0024976E24|nr:SGNH/GDSL hydrolase family protein [Psychrobacillus sp. NEAU-3TGS]MDI2587677.1 SGNH/GDSL hydrolase family protein [Psychrobacillus sp. NEAU-3TGS]